MSPQIIELLLFACVAFFLVSKLISVLGTTTENDKTRGGSFFGEPAVGMKDVTSKPVILTQKNLFSDIITKDASTKIAENLAAIADRIPSFEPRRFVDGSKFAFKMLIEALVTKDQDTINGLVDKRFLDEFNELSNKYGSIKDIDSLDAKISESYMFGNNAFMKILFTGNGVASNLPKIDEEWTFTKSSATKGSDWYLSNIDMV